MLAAVISGGKKQASMFYRIDVWIPRAVSVTRNSSIQSAISGPSPSIRSRAVLRISRPSREPRGNGSACSPKGRFVTE